MVKLNPGKFYASPSGLYRQVEASMEKTKRYLAVFEKQLRKYRTRHFDGKFQEGDGEDFLENHYHDWLSYIIPRTAFENPKVRLSTKLGGHAADVGRALHRGIDRWIRDVRLNEKIVAPCVDMQFNRGVLMVTQDPIPGYDPRAGLDPDDPDLEETPHAPSVTRIPQDSYFEDSVARQRGEIRFQGHIGFRDKADLIAEAKANPDLGWNLDAITALGTADTATKLNRIDADSSEERGEVTWYEVWLPELELDAYPDGAPAPSDGWKKHGYHGTILTLSTEAPNTEIGQKEQWLREPRPYYGPPCGPYQVFGVYEIPNETRHLSPLTVVEEQVIDLNKHARSQSDSAADYKRIVIVNHTSPRIVSIVKSTEHHNVAAIPGFKREGIQQVELGGITDQQIAYQGIARERLNRNSHMDDARRGEVQAGQTATGIAEASIAGDVRVSWVEECFVRGVAGVLRKVLWYLHMDNRVVFPTGVEGLEEGDDIVLDPDGNEVIAPESVWFVGGDEGVPYEALELEIEPYSMKRLDDEERRQGLAMALDQSIGLLPVVQAFPKGVQWKLIFDDVGELNRVPDWGKRFDVDELLEQPPTLDPRLAEPMLASMGGGRLRATYPRFGGTAGGGRALGPSQMGGQMGQAMPSLGGGGQAGRMGAPAMAGGAPISGGIAGQKAMTGAGVR